MKRICGILAILVLTAATGTARAQSDASTGSCSLRAAAMTALAQRPGLQAADLNRQAQASGVAAAWGRLLPEVRVDAFYTHMNEDMVLDLDPIRNALIALQTGNAVSFANIESMLTQGRQLSDAERAAVSLKANAGLEQALPHFQEILKEQSFLQGAVTIRQPIFTGGKILAGIRAAQAQENMANAKYDARREEILTEVVVRYLAVLLAKENARVREQAELAVARHEKRAARLLEQGIIARHDKLRAEVALAEAERNRFDAREKLRIACSALAAATGSSTQAITASDTLAFAEAAEKLSFLQEEVREKNSTLRQMREGSTALKEKASAQFGNYFPTVYAFGMYNLFDHYMIEKAEPKWAVGIGASFTLFDGARRTHEYQEAQMEADAMRLMTEDATRSMALLARNANMEIALSRERYLQLAAAEEQAEENTRLNVKRFEEGLGTSLEVLDAQLQLDATKLQRAAALHDYYSSVFALCKVSGNTEEFFRQWEIMQSNHKKDGDE
ncbi:MAG: TolC family protein [Bacteroidetes bacterium]|nr:TolC family protein [Bacteroidota bacterium]